MIPVERSYDPHTAVVLYRRRGPAVQLIPISALLIVEDTLPVSAGDHLQSLARRIVELGTVEGHHVALVGAGIDIFHAARGDDFVTELHLFTVGGRQSNDGYAHADTSASLGSGAVAPR